MIVTRRPEDQFAGQQVLFGMPVPFAVLTIDQQAQVSILMIMPADFRKRIVTRDVHPETYAFFLFALRAEIGA